MHAADNVSHMSGEGHFCIKSDTQVTYCLTRRYWCAFNSQTGAQGSEFGLVMTRDYDLKTHSFHCICGCGLKNHQSFFALRHRLLSLASSLSSCSFFFDLNVPRPASLRSARSKLRRFEQCRPVVDLYFLDPNSANSIAC